MNLHTFRLSMLEAGLLLPLIGLVLRSSLPGVIGGEIGPLLGGVFALGLCSLGLG